MVDVHFLGLGDVDARVQDRRRQGPGRGPVHRQRAGFGAPVPDGAGSGPDAEGGHHVVEDAVVVVRAEDDRDLRIEVPHEVPDLVEGRS